MKKRRIDIITKDGLMETLVNDGYNQVTSIVLVKQNLSGMIFQLPKFMFLHKLTLTNCEFPFIPYKLFLNLSFLRELRLIRLKSVYVVPKNIYKLVHLEYLFISFTLSQGKTFIFTENRNFRINQCLKKITEMFYETDELRTVILQFIQDRSSIFPKDIRKMLAKLFWKDKPKLFIQ